MNKSQLFQHIKKKQSYLCIGLDTDINKIPPHLLKTDDPVFEFNKQIIDATKDYCVAYKPNTAFYEALGSRGWESLQKTLDYIPKDIFTIADAKRGDIGNTSQLYAKAFFETMDFDGITVAPYMGEDSVKPFLTYKNKWVIVLIHTSNDGSKDFQLLVDRNSGKRLYEEVLEKCLEWGTSNEMMFVVGATRVDKIRHIRTLAPANFFLVPGIGTQGGSLEQVSAHGMNESCGLLVNASRSIIYASQKENFADAARHEAGIIQTAMKDCLDKYL